MDITYENGDVIVRMTAGELEQISNDIIQHRWHVSPPGLELVRAARAAWSARISALALLRTR